MKNKTKDRSSLLIAIKMCFRYIRFSKTTFLIAFVASIFSTFFNVCSIVLVGLLSTKLNDYLSSGMTT